MEQIRQETGSLSTADGPSGSSRAFTAGSMFEREPVGLATALGWFGVGLGVAQILAPRAVSRMIGLNDHSGLMRLCGARELVSGVGIVSQRRRAGWFWLRVAGDAMDLALLGAAVTSDRGRSDRAAAAAVVVSGVTALDVLCAQQLGRTEGRRERSIRTRKSMHINRPPEEAYRFWRDFPNLARVIPYLESVELIDRKRSRWVAKAPGGKSIEWEAELIEDRPNELIAWRSIEGSSFETAGSVRFEKAPGDRGTIVRIDLQYRPPAGLLGARLTAALGREPGQQLQEGLRRMKQLVEAGEIITTIGQPAGRARSTSWKYDRAIQPGAGVRQPARVEERMSHP